MQARLTETEESKHLSEVGRLAGLILSNLVQSVLAALLAFAVGLSLLGHGDHG